MERGGAGGSDGGRSRKLLLHGNGLVVDIREGLRGRREIGASGCRRRGGIRRDMSSRSFRLVMPVFVGRLLASRSLEREILMPWLLLLLLRYLTVRARTRHRGDVKRYRGARFPAVGRIKQRQERRALRGEHTAE